MTSKDNPPPLGPSYYHSLITAHSSFASKHPLTAIEPNRMFTRKRHSHSEELAEIQRV